jgi:hypothetical protein
MSNIEFFKSLKNRFLQTFPRFKVDSFTSSKTTAVSIENIVQSLDSNSPVIQGAIIKQKFSSTKNSVFEDRFVWVDIATQTIHLSTFPNKERRHKEANLSDVTRIIAEIPSMYDSTSTPDGEKNLKDRCITIDFRKGKLSLYVTSYLSHSF